MKNDERIGTSPIALECIKRKLNRLYEPPDADTKNLREMLATRFHLPENCIAVGNGSTELMNILAQTKHGGDSEIIASSPSFSLYKLLAELYSYRFIEVPLNGYQHDLRKIREVSGETTRLIFLDSPANITGSTIAENDFIQFLKLLPAKTIVVYDNVYAEYQDVNSDEFIYDLVIKYALPVVICRSFSKAHALYGLRIGYMLGRADLIESVRRYSMPYEMNTISQCAAIASIKDEKNIARNISLNNQAKQMVYDCLNELGVAYIPTQSNALLINFGQKIVAVEKFCSEHNVRVRGQLKCGLAGHLQIFLIDPPSVRLFIKVIKEYIKVEKP